MRGWVAWGWDVPTALWVLWGLFFVVLESWAVVLGHQEHTLTWHLRPFLLRHPLAWFVALGVGLWLVAHFLFPLFERSLVETVAG